MNCCYFDLRNNGPEGTVQGGMWLQASCGDNYASHRCFLVLQNVHLNTSYEYVVASTLLS